MENEEDNKEDFEMNNNEDEDIGGGQQQVHTMVGQDEEGVEEYPGPIN